MLFLLGGGLLIARSSESPSSWRVICFIDIAGLWNVMKHHSPQVRPHDCSVSDPCIKCKKSQQKHDWGTIGANFPGQCQGAELFDTGYQMAVATTSKLSWKLWDEWRHGYQPGERLTVCVCFCFFVDLQELWRKNKYIYIYTQLDMSQREQSKWSKDLCISAVAVVSLIISMFFSYFHGVMDWI